MLFHVVGVRVRHERHGPRVMRIEPQIVLREVKAVTVENLHKNVFIQTIETELRAVFSAYEVAAARLWSRRLEV
ncbi:MAG TPA: hypothetical protein VF627_11490, partial [Abditibacterium sp.]